MYKIKITEVTQLNLYLAMENMYSFNCELLRNGKFIQIISNYNILCVGYYSCIIYVCGENVKKISHLSFRLSIF